MSAFCAYEKLEGYPGPDLHSPSLWRQDNYNTSDSLKITKIESLDIVLIFGSTIPTGSNRFIYGIQGVAAFVSRDVWARRTRALDRYRKPDTESFAT